MKLFFYTLVLIEALNSCMSSRKGGTLADYNDETIKYTTKFSNLQNPFDIQ
jgi:hypothetical protein